MADEKRAELERANRLVCTGLKNNVIGLTRWARRLETAVKIGAYDDADAPALNELTYIISVMLSRAQMLIDVDRIIVEEQRRVNEAKEK